MVIVPAANAYQGRMIDSVSQTVASRAISTVAIATPPAIEHPNAEIDNQHLQPDGDEQHCIEQVV